MVEKIIVSPESIRGLGNIVMPKTGADFRSVDCTVLVGTDTVNDETVTVFTLESDVTLLSVVLSVDDSSVVVGESVTLSATVTDEMTQPVEGATVSFKLNGNVLGTADTNSSGVATYSYTTVSDGTLVFSSVCSNNSSNSVNVTVTGHNYSLEFDSTDYTVVGGSVVIKVGLTDNSAVVPNVSVSLSGGGSSWSATTDTDGVATFNLSNVTTGGTYTASYNGATATCTVTIAPSVIWEDNFNRSSLGSDWVTFGTGANASISNNQLVFTRTGNGRGGIYFNQEVTGNYKITLDFASGDYDNVNLGIAISGTSWKCYEVEPKWYFGYITIGSNGSITQSLHEQRTSGITYTSATIVYEVIQDTTIKMYINGTLKGTYNCQDGTTDGYVGITQCCGRTSRYNSIKVEPL